MWLLYYKYIREAHDNEVITNVSSLQQRIKLFTLGQIQSN